jgi:hypothetical protein
LFWRKLWIAVHHRSKSMRAHGTRKMAVGSRIFKRVGAGKVNHEDKDLELMKAAEWMKIVLVWRASMPFEAQLPSEHTNLAGSVYFVAHELQP